MPVDHASHNTAFAQGMQKQLVKRAKEVMSKSALNPRIAEQVFLNPKRTPELALLGQRLFAESHHQPNPVKGLLSTGLAGYGQLRDLHALRGTHIKELGALNKGLARLTAGSAEHNNLAQYIANKLQTFKAMKRQRLAEVGAVAEPRIKFFSKTLPMAALGGGALAGGSVIGNLGGTARAQQDVSQAPFAERLNYLLHPNDIQRPARPVPQTVGGTPSSATDTGTI